MEVFPEGTNLQGATLVLVTVSVGNVGQLAADLLINTFQMDRCARLQDDALLPAVGSRGFAHVDGLTSAMELYQQQPAATAGSSGSGKVVVVQQRAPAAPGTQDAFAQRLAAFVRQAGVKEVLVLGSIEATFRRDAQLAGPQLRFWGPSQDAPTDWQQQCSGRVALQPLEPSFFEDRPLQQRQLPPWPLLRHMQQEGVPCTAVLSFSTEGDNVGDAFVMAAAAARAVGLVAADAEAAQQPQWAPPQSWQYVYGPPPAMY